MGVFHCYMTSGKIIVCQAGMAWLIRVILWKCFPIRISSEMALAQGYEMKSFLLRFHKLAPLAGSYVQLAVDLLNY